MGNGLSQAQTLEKLVCKSKCGTKEIFKKQIKIIEKTILSDTPPN